MTPETASPTALPGIPGSPVHESPSYSTDELFDFFDFFDKTVEDVYAYILHCTRVAGLAADITLSVYFSLLQRRRFFWWKNIIQLSTVLALADKAIASMRAWEEEATGHDYIEALLRCMPEEQGTQTVEQMRLLFHALKQLPLREQRMAVLALFLHWPAEKTALVTGREKENIRKEYEAIMEILIATLGKESMFQNTNIRQLLEKIHCPVLPETKKASLRVALLERCRAAQMSSLRFALPIASLLIVASGVVGCILLVSTFLVEPLSLRAPLEEIAAVEVLLLDQEVAVRDAFLASERHLRSIAAEQALPDVARISLRLAPLAAREQLSQEKVLEAILEKLGGSTAQSTTALSFRAESAIP